MSRDGREGEGRGGAGIGLIVIESWIVDLCLRRWCYHVKPNIIDSEKGFS